MKLPELLAPAGNFEKLKTALHYGADAVYMGLSEFSLRAKADNFTSQELQNAAQLVRASGKNWALKGLFFPESLLLMRSDRSGIMYQLNWSVLCTAQYAYPIPVDVI